MCAFVQFDVPFFVKNSCHSFPFLSQLSPLFCLFPICSFPFLLHTVSFFGGGAGCRRCRCCCCSVCWSVTPLTDFRFYCLSSFVARARVFIAKGKEIALEILPSMCRNIMALKLDSDRKIFAFGCSIVLQTHSSWNCVCVSFIRLVAQIDQ